MATQVFKQQNVKVKKVFTAKQAKLTFGPPSATPAVTGVLVQGLNFNYSQNITRLYEIGSIGGGSSQSTPDNVYYVVGRTQGQAQVNRVVGPEATITELYERYGDACKACNNTLELDIGDASGDCCQGAKLKYTMEGCALQQIGVSLQAQDMIINENCQIMFSGLTWEK